MTYYEFKEESYSEQYQDNIESVLANLEEARYTLGEDVCAAMAYDKLEADF